MLREIIQLSFLSILGRKAIKDPRSSFSFSVSEGTSHPTVNDAVGVVAFRVKVGFHVYGASSLKDPKNVWKLFDYPRRSRLDGRCSTCCLQTRCIGSDQNALEVLRMGMLVLVHEHSMYQWPSIATCSFSVDAVAVSGPKHTPCFQQFFCCLHLFHVAIVCKCP